MTFEKKIIGHTNKCYAVAPFTTKESESFLVASEKPGPCIRFDLEGNLLETIWEQPGGTMSMAQVPGSDNQLLATHRFYSPNDSKEACIVLATRENSGEWRVQTIANLPHVHRFGVIERGGVNYLIAATICSGRDYKDDWSHPGKIYACPLPAELSSYTAENPLPLKPLMDGLTKNHGYWQGELDGIPTVAIASDNGVFSFCPPASPGEAWDIKQILNEPVSDVTFVDFDGDGRPEMLALLPFHGDSVRIYRQKQGIWHNDATLPFDAEFAHAIWSGRLNGSPTAIVGYRRGRRGLFLVRWESGQYLTEEIDHDVGPANVYCYRYKGVDKIVAANREIDEIAIYTLQSL